MFANVVIYVIQHVFQSLFWWIVVWKRGNGARTERRKRTFQSLFWWIVVWKVGLDIAAEKELGVSILVLVDRGLEVQRGF